jgi:predicted dienelactone hydrolase
MSNRPSILENRIAKIMRWYAVTFAVFLMWAVSGVLLFGWPLSAFAADIVGQTVGFKQISHDEVDIGIWYPSSSPVNRDRLGPFDVAYADEGTPLAGCFPVVVMSHGLMGRFRNHHLTAAALVRGGYVVVAPTHAHDQLVFDNEILKAMEHRIHNLDQALSLLFDDPHLGEIVRSSPINGVGYSLGSATMLLAIGGVVDLDRLEAHCQADGDKDVNFCSKVRAPWYVELFGWLMPDDKAPRRFGPSNKALDGTIALIAPMGQAIDFAAIGVNNGKIGIFAFEDDAEVPVAFHAEVLRKHLAPTASTYKEYANTHHYAFIAPFPKWLTDKEDIPVAKDPPGFDRGAFLTQINQDIVTFFTR